MSSNPRGPPMGRYGSEGDYKRRKNFYASLTRRDFKSSGQTSNGNSGPGLALLLQLKPPQIEYGSRPRFRDSLLTNSVPAQSRANSYTKDSRYGYGKLYSSYSPGYYHERNGERGSERRDERREEKQGERTGAYGSFGSQRDSDYSTATSRDMVNTSSLRDGLPSSRDSWRGERPKLNSSGSQKLFSSGRFNPNSIPISLRSSLNGLVLSVFGDHRKDRYDSYNDEQYGNRWKSQYLSPRMEKGNRPPRLNLARPHQSKERIRSSGLTNSVSSSRRGESYYPSKSFLSLGSRYADRYNGGKDYESLGDRNEDYSESYGTRSILPSTESYKYADTSREDDSAAGYDEAYDRSRNEHDNEEEEEEIDEEDEEDEENENEMDEDEEEDEEDGEETEVKGNQVETEAVAESTEIPKELKSIPGLDTVDKKTQESQPEQPAKSILPQSVSAGPVDLNGPDDYPEGCNFPLTEVESQFAEMSQEFQKSEFSGVMRFAVGKPVTDLSEYLFFEENLIRFSHSFPSILKVVQGKKDQIKKKKLSLWVQYATLKKENDHRGVFLEEQLKVLHPPDDDSRRELESIDIRVKSNESPNDQQVTNLDSPAQSGRRGRRHGDLVTTEAEFQEILKTLEKEDNEDPLIRAERVAAKIPDQVLDPSEKETLKYMDSNNIVHDKEAWTHRVKTDFMDNFTEREHDLFCEAFCRFPKRFGQISRYMGGVRDSEECVIHYYMTKKAVNYKFLVSQFKKKTSKKATRRKSKAKTAVLDSATSEALPIVDLMENEVIEPVVETKEEVLGKRSAETLEGPEDTDLTPKKKAKTKKEEVAPVLSPEVPLPSETQQLPILQEEQTGLPSSDGTPLAPGSDFDEKKKHISSYWSITEVNEFPILLKMYGSRWSSIADKLTTKTATMVRNYYQRNGGKHGWGEIVQSADYRLAHTSNTEDGNFSNVDTTIVVKPQKTSYVDAPKTEIHVYDTIDDHMRAQDASHSHLHTPPVPAMLHGSAPMGTFHHSAPYFPLRLPGLLHAAPDVVKRLNVNELLSNGPYHQPEVTSYSSQPIQRAPILPNLARLERPVPPIFKEAQKPSITSLLNSENTVKPEPAAPKPGNLALLLNSRATPSAPAPEPKERKNSIKSLLSD